MSTTLHTPKGPVILREARDEDLDAFRRLRLEALRDNPANFGSDYAASKALPKEYWTKRLSVNSEEGKTYLAFSSEMVIAMCGILLGSSPKTRHNATIYGVYVKPEWQGLHIARELIELCAGWGREHGVKLLKLAVVANNAAAIRSYTACGFTAYGTDPKAICVEGKFYDELLMFRRVK
jgi:ribosomal protein S18 acetylase RimI-like enzyme